jgi:cytochrome c5
MKRNVTFFLFILLIAAAFLGTSMRASAQQMDSQSKGQVDLKAAKATFEATCSKCHALSRPLGKKKDRAGWETTVKRMSSHHADRFGAPIPDKDQEAIVQYLLSVAGK